MLGKKKNYSDDKSVCHTSFVRAFKISVFIAGYLLHGVANLLFLNLCRIKK